MKKLLCILIGVSFCSIAADATFDTLTVNKKIKILSSASSLFTLKAAAGGGIVFSSRDSAGGLSFAPGKGSSDSVNLSLYTRQDQTGLYFAMKLNRATALLTLHTGFITDTLGTESTDTSQLAPLVVRHGDVVSAIFPKSGGCIITPDIVAVDASNDPADGGFTAYGSIMAKGGFKTLSDTGYTGTVDIAEGRIIKGGILTGKN